MTRCSICRKMLYSADAACDACSDERNKLGIAKCKLAIDRYFAAEDELIHGGNLYVRAGTFKATLRRFFASDCDPGKTSANYDRPRAKLQWASRNLWDMIVREYEDRADERQI